MEARRVKPDFGAIAKATYFSKSELRRLYRRFLVIADLETNAVNKAQFLSQPEVCHCCIMPLAVDHALRCSEAGKEWIQLYRRSPSNSSNSTSPATPSELPDMPPTHPGAAGVVDLHPSEQPVERPSDAPLHLTVTEQELHLNEANIGLNFVEYVQVLSKFSVRASLAEKDEYLFSILDSDGDGRLQEDDMYRYYCSMLSSRYTPAALRQLTKRAWRTICPRGETAVLRAQFFGKCLNATELQFAMTIHY